MYVTGLILHTSRIYSSTLCEESIFSSTYTVNEIILEAQIVPSARMTQFIHTSVLHVSYALSKAVFNHIFQVWGWPVAILYIQYL